MFYLNNYDYFFILRYELKGKSFVMRQIEAKKLWSQIIQSQIETGLPLLLFKDACNAKSNESHLGTIQCAGRNGDTVQFTASDEVTFIFYLYN